MSEGLLLPFNGVFPRIGSGVYLAPGSVIIGDVDIGADSSVWFNAVIQGDVAAIRIGQRSNIQDGAVLHVDRAPPASSATRSPSDTRPSSMARPWETG